MAQTHALLLCRCTAPNNEIFKKPYISKRHKITGVVMKEGTSLTNPHFIIKTPEKLLRYNYCYSYDFKRDYFIEDIIALPQGQVELICKIDVLYTYRDAICNLVVHEERATDGESNLIVDEKVPVMHNTIIDKIIPMDMRTPFNPVQQFIVNVLTGNKFVHTGVDLTSYNIGVIRATLCDDAVEICKAIVARAMKYWNDYTAYKNSVEEYSKSGQWDKLFPTNFMYAQDNSYKAPFSIRGNNLNGFFNRYCTSYSDEDISGLTYIDGTTYPSGTPQAIRDAGVVWNSWDCSQFAWRCCRFNSELPMNIANFGSGSLDNTGNSYTAGEATAMGNKTVTYDLQYEDESWESITESLDVTDSIFSKEDLVAGDIIISGSVSNHPSYWVYLVRIDSDYYWYKTDSYTNYELGNALFEKLMEMHPNVDNIHHIIGVNHARVYIGNGKCIESCSPNHIDEVKDGGHIISYSPYLNSALCMTDVPEISERKCTAITGTVSLGMSKGCVNMRQLMYGSSKACRVYRPALLGNDSKRITYDEWRNREGM